MMTMMSKNIAAYVQVKGEMPTDPIKGKNQFMQSTVHQIFQKKCSSSQKKYALSEMYILEWLLESTIIYTLFDRESVNMCVVIYSDSMCAPFVTQQTSIL